MDCLALRKPGKTDKGTALYSRKEAERSIAPVTFGLIRDVINGLPIAKSRGAVFLGETAGDAGIVALGWVDMLPAEVKENIFQKGIQWDEVHGVLHKGVIYIITVCLP
ncbi:hypothetical protein [Desulfocastanea catecholica]